MMANDPKKKHDPAEEPKTGSQVIPPGTEQETGLNRFIRQPDENPEEVKDAKLNNLEETDPARHGPNPNDRTEKP
jgi:hypothetical protein